jgi:hypothetical protein
MLEMVKFYIEQHEHIKRDFNGTILNKNMKLMNVCLSDFRGYVHADDDDVWDYFPDLATINEFNRVLTDFKKHIDSFNNDQNSKKIEGIKEEFKDTYNKFLTIKTAWLNMRIRDKHEEIERLESLKPTEEDKIK